MSSRLVSTCSGVTQIDLSGNGLGAEGAKILGPALAVAGVLTAADLRWNFLGNAGKKLLRAALKKRRNFDLKL